MHEKYVLFNLEKFKRLKERYEQAVKSGEEKFIFDGEEYLTAYAKYLVAYLGSQL